MADIVVPTSCPDVRRKTTDVIQSVALINYNGKAVVQLKNTHLFGDLQTCYARFSTGYYTHIHQLCFSQILEPEKIGLQSHLETIPMSEKQNEEVCEYPERFISLWWNILLKLMLLQGRYQNPLMVHWQATIPGKKTIMPFFGDISPIFLRLKRCYIVAASSSLLIPQKLCSMSNSEKCQCLREPPHHWGFSWSSS